MSLNTLFYSRKTSKSPYPWVLLAFPLSFSPCLPAWSNRGDKENLPQASDVVCLSPGTVHCLQSLLIDRDRVTGRWGLFDVINANKAAWLLCLQRIEPPNPKPAACSAKTQARTGACLRAHCSVNSRRRALSGRKNVMFLMLVPSYFFFPPLEKGGKKMPLLWGLSSSVIT